MWNVSFSIGQYYQDEVTCDVVEMDACQMLLGMPWQFNVNAVHKEKHIQHNVYVFNWKVQRIDLLPTPSNNTKGSYNKQKRALVPSVPN